jgi:leucyl/phenylalanyl-tRNA--protein transferase
MVVELDDELWFPDPHIGEPDGLIAVGGDLSVDRLLLAYSYGIFPWFSFRDSEKPYWYCPLRRFVIFPSEIHVSHSMRTLMRKGRFHCSMNEDFEGVIANCSRLRIEEEGAWLGPDIIEAYTELHKQGFATSVEVWDTADADGETGGRKLVGGLYGVTLGRSFFGESMFSLVPSASKLALIYLSRFMEKYGGVLIDCQFETPHLKNMGGRYIDYDEYMAKLKDE